MRSSYGKFVLGIGLLWVMMIVGFSAVYVLIFLPQKSEMAKVCTELEGKKADIEKARQLVHAENFNKKLEEIEALKARLRSFALDYESTTEVTLSISELAEQIHLDSFSIQNEPGDLNIEIENCETLYENRFEVDFHSHFNQFAQMINHLERHKPYVFIDEFEISRSDRITMNPVEMNLAVLVTKPTAITQYLKDNE